MAEVTGTFSSYDSVGTREDLSDVIYDISPVETPVVSLAAKVTATQKKHEWQTKDLVAANKDNAQVEGFDVTTYSQNQTARIYNLTQLHTKQIKVSHAQEASTHAGRASEVDMQVADKLLEIRRDLEARVTSNEVRVDGDDTATAREMSGLACYVATNDNFASGGASPVGADGSAARTDGSALRPFLESQFKNVIQLQWSAGGMPDTVVLDAHNKQVFSGFSGNNTRFSNSDDARLVATIEVYRSDFGTMRIVPSRFTRATTGDAIGDVWSIQSDMLAIADLIPANTFELAKVGSSHRRMIEHEPTLEVRNEKALGLVTDLTLS